MKVGDKIILNIIINEFQYFLSWFATKRDYFSNCLGSRGQWWINLLWWKSMTKLYETSLIKSFCIILSWLSTKLRLSYLKIDILGTSHVFNVFIINVVWWRWQKYSTLSKSSENIGRIHWPSIILIVNIYRGLDHV